MLGELPIAKLGHETLESASPRPVSPYYSDMSLEMQEQFNASLLGDITPREAARNLKENLENLIQQGQDS